MATLTSSRSERTDPTALAPDWSLERSRLTLKILSGTGQQSVARLLSAGASFAALLLMSRLPDKGEFGIYNYYLTAFSMAATFINFGANGIAVREMSRHPARTGALLGAVIKFKLLAGVLGFLVVAALAVTHERSVSATLLVCAATLHLIPLAWSSAVTVFHARLEFLVPSVSLVAGMGVFAVTAFVAYRLGAESAGVYLILFALGQLVQGFIVFFAARRRVAISYELGWSEFRPVFREMTPIGVSAVAATVYYYVNTILLRDLRSDLEVGQFNAAYRLVTLAIMVPTFFTQALFPVMSRQAIESPRALAVVLQRSFLYLVLLGAPVACALQILAPQVIGTLYQPELAPAAVPLKWLGWAMLAIFASSPLVTALTAIGRQAAFTKIALGAGAINVLMNLLLIPRFGLGGAAATTLATEAFVLAACAGVLRGRLGLPIVSRELWRKGPVVCAAVALTAMLVREWSLWIEIPILACVQVGVLFLLRCLPVDLLAGYEATPETADR